MTTARVLVIDDDQAMRASLAHLLEAAGYSVILAKGAEEGLEHLQKSRPDVILCDVRMPGMNGLEFQTKARDLGEVPVILITAHGDIPMAVAALQDGAYSFVEKPFEPRRLLGILANAVRMKRLVDSTVILQDRLTALTDLERVLIGDSPQIKAVRDMVFDFAASAASVLILGDTGTGKELVARALHDLGPTPTAPFVAVNCAVIPPDRFEQTVFGTADAPHGLLAEADGGTLFLDELGSMPHETQAKMLRVIETKQYQRVGEAAVQTATLRVISAATPDLMTASSFREDLLFRLNTLMISLPALSERGEDMLLLFRHYLIRLSQLYDVTPPPLTPDDIAAVMAYPWPGNVRELQNVAERRVLAERRGGGSVRRAIALHANQPHVPGTLREAVAAFERELIGRALKEQGGRMEDVASLLGIGRRTLNEKIVKLGLDKDAVLGD